MDQAGHVGILICIEIEEQTLSVSVWEHPQSHTWNF